MYSDVVGASGGGVNKPTWSLGGGNADCYIFTLSDFLAFALLAVDAVGSY